MCSSQSVHQVRQMQTLQTLQTWCTLHPSWSFGIVSRLGPVHDGPLARAYVEKPGTGPRRIFLVCTLQVIFFVSMGWMRPVHFPFVLMGTVATTFYSSVVLTGPSAILVFTWSVLFSMKVKAQKAVEVDQRKKSAVDYPY